VLLSAALGALLSGLLWFGCSLANMSGIWAGVADPEVLWTVLNETAFGSVWLARMLLAVVILGVTAVRPLWMAIAGRDLITACRWHQNGITLRCGVQIPTSVFSLGAAVMNK
jgi:copper resistance protein D